jgi:hypothetical protein
MTDRISARQKPLIFKALVQNKGLFLQNFEYPNKHKWHFTAEHPNGWTQSIALPAVTNERFAEALPLAPLPWRPGPKHQPQQL